MEKSLMPCRPENINNALIRRLNRIEGQVRGIKSMIEKDAYCDDILSQIASAQSALNGVSKILLESHIKTCISPRLADGDEDAVGEMIKSIGRML